MVKAENQIQISGDFPAKGKVGGSGFKQLKKHNATSFLGFHRNKLQLNIASPDTGKQIAYSCLIQKINTKANDFFNWTIECNIYDLTANDNDFLTRETTGYFHIEIVKNKISLAKCDTKDKNASAYFIGF